MSFRVVSFVLLVALGALGQKHPSADLLQKSQFDGSPELRLQGMQTWSSLPDAPSPIQPQTPAEKFHAFVNEARLPVTMGALNVHAGVMSKTELRYVTLEQQPSSALFHQSLPIQKELGPSAFWGKYLHPSSLKQDQAHYPIGGGGTLMGRACYAASRLLVTHDDAGKVRLNTSYFLAVLTSSAIHAAYRPYRTRSTSTTFNDFGSTIGSDAGINVFHEFEPGIRLIVQGHTPKFVSKIGARIIPDHTRWNGLSIPAR
jgi:hypothetical protein